MSDRVFPAVSRGLTTSTSISSAIAIMVRMSSLLSSLYSFSLLYLKLSLLFQHSVIYFSLTVIGHQTWVVTKSHLLVLSTRSLTSASTCLAPLLLLLSSANLPALPSFFFLVHHSEARLAIRISRGGGVPRILAPFMPTGTVMVSNCF